MSLAKQIAARMLAKKSTAAAPAPCVVSPPARHTSPQAYNPPKVPRAERRVRQSLGQLARTAPEPVRTSAQPLPEVSPLADLCEGLDRAGAKLIFRRAPVPPPVPPRAELDVDLVQALQALPLPASPASSAPAPTVRGRGSCFAIDAETGRQCRLPAHPESPDRHRHERGPFFRLLQAGAVPRLREALDSASMRAVNTEVYNGASHVRGEQIPKAKGQRAQPGALKAAIHRNKAHAGEITTEAHPPERSKYFTDALSTNPEVS